MNKKLSIALLAAASFAIGLFSGLGLGYIHVPATPPPDWLFSEFKSITKPGNSLQNVVQSRPDLWRGINKELYSLKPQIDEYRKNLLQIDEKFCREFTAILSEKQNEKLCEAQLQKVLPKLPALKTEAPKLAAGKLEQSKAEPAKPVNLDKQPRMYQESSDGQVGSVIFVPFVQERYTQVLGLDDAQQAMLHDLLLARRERFLRLCDQTPPPSLQLSRIADIIREAESSAKQEPAK